MFLYYLPGQTFASITVEVLTTAGLAMPFRDALENPRAFADRVIRRQVHAGGPDGGSGALIALQPADGRDVGPIGCHPQRQLWLDCGGYWLGREAVREPDALPGPEVLARPRLLPGPLVTLGDGRDWQVPIVRRLARESALPARLGFSDAGQFEMRPLPEYDAAWEASGEMFDHVVNCRSMAFRRVLTLCAEILSLNYRVGEREIAALGLITTENYERIYDAAIDLAKVLALIGPEAPAVGAESDKPPAPEKKTPPAASSISPGPPADSPITLPREVICTS